MKRRSKRIRRGLIACILAGIIFVPGLSAQEDGWYLGKPIADIRFEGLSSVSENELLGLIRPYFGQIYDDGLSWDIQGKLYALDYFDLIIPQIQPGDSAYESVVLIFQVEEKPLVESILFTGNQKIRRGELIDTVLVKAGDMLNPAMLRLDEQSVLALYLEKGFIDAQVVSEYQVDDQANTATVVFNIVEGNQTKISEIRFVGNDVHVSDNTLRGLMSTKPQSLFNRGLFVETKLQEDLNTIQRYYGDEGFIDMAIVEVDKQIIFDEEELLNKMIITIVIDEGEQWFYGGMTFNGNRIYTTEELNAMVLQQPGRAFSRTKFQLDYQRVTDLYFENGYIFNTFTYEEIRNEERREVSYVVEIVERDRAHIENIIIRGNDKTLSYVIRREIPLEEGEVFSKTKIFEGMRNLYNTGFFDIVEPVPYPGSEDGLMDLIIDVSEGKTADIGFGLSFSGGPDFPISGQLTWNDRNFLGRGQTLGVEITASPDTQRASIRFTEPRLLGLRWSGGFDVSYSHSVNRYINQDRDGNGVPDPYETWEEYEAANRVVPNDYQMEYDSQYISTGFSTGYSWPTRIGLLGLSTGIRFTWEYASYDDTVYRPNSVDIRDNLENWLYNDSINLRLAWDTRDYQASPSKGFILSQSFTWAGLVPFSRRDYIKTVSRYTQYFKILDIPTDEEGQSFRTILQLHTAFQGLFAKPWSDNSVDPQRDGFYIDGMFVGRGWQPVSDGQFLWENTIQFVIPMVPNVLAFDLFLDGVGLWTSRSTLRSIAIQDFRFSLGAGLRFDNPQFPIGIYLVKKFRWNEDGTVDWNPEPDDAELKNWGMDIVIAFQLDIY